MCVQLVCVLPGCVCVHANSSCAVTRDRIWSLGSVLRSHRAHNLLVCQTKVTLVTYQSEECAGLSVYGSESREAGWAGFAKTGQKFA